ncbi:MAG: hypothetical protein ABI579_05570 [Candidatus Sumerlaeota bacterium]
MTELRRGGTSQVIATLTGKAGIWLAFAWGFAEGTLFFLIPDIIITFAALFAPKKSVWHLSAVLVGSLIGGSIMYCWGVQNLIGAKRAVDAVPFVPSPMLDKVDGDYSENGVIAMLHGPASGIPYKVYAILAPHHQIGFPKFLLMSIPARLERLVITWLLFGAFGLAFRKLWESKPVVGISIHAIYWIAIYTFYWMKVGANA